jgi:hypothetical protein
MMDMEPTDTGACAQHPRVKLVDMEPTDAGACAQHPHVRMGGVESVDGFDVVEVIGRAVALDPAVASTAELLWADRAADRVRGWVDAWQARVHVELTLPRPTPDDAGPGGDGSSGSGDDAPGDGLPGGDLSGDGDAAGADGDPGSLPSLGDGPGPAESARERERKARRARLLADLPALADMLRAGRVSTVHVDVLAAALAAVPEVIRHRVIDDAAGLLTVAAGCNPDRFSRAVHHAITVAFDREGVERLTRQRSQSHLRRGINPVTGMYWLNAQLDPERGALLFARLDTEREALFHRGDGANLASEQVELQTLLHLTSTTGGEQKSAPRRAHVSILIDVATLSLGVHDRTVCETSTGDPLPVDVARRLVCAAKVSYGFSIDGRIVHHVTSSSLATADQRRELRMMHRTCIGADCDVPFEHCQIHHVIPRSRDGPTAIPLLVPVCTRHHDDIHHHGWVLQIDDHRHITWTTPHGATIDVPFVGLSDRPSLFPPQPDAAA